MVQFGEIFGCYIGFIISLILFITCLLIGYLIDGTLLKIVSWCLLLPLVIGLFFVDMCKYNSPTRISSRIEKAIEYQKYDQAYSQLKTLRKHIYNDKAFEELYEPLEEKLFKAEIIFLLNDGDLGSTEHIISLVQDIQVRGVPSEGVVSDKKIRKQNELYIRSVSRYNYLVDEVLNQVIILKKYDLAEKLFPLYRPNLSKTLYNSHLLSQDEYKYEFTNNDRNRAEERYKKIVSFPPQQKKIK